MSSNSLPIKHFYEKNKPQKHSFAFFNQ